MTDNKRIYSAWFHQLMGDEQLLLQETFMNKWANSHGFNSYEDYIEINDGCDE